MVYAVINPDIQNIIAIAIIVLFAVIGLIKGIYGLVSPVAVAVLSVVSGIVLSGRMEPIADSRFLTFIIMSAAAWVVLTLIKKLLSKVADWFVIGWVNHLVGLIAGLVIGCVVQSFVFGLIKLIGGR